MIPIAAPAFGPIAIAISAWLMGRHNARSTKAQVASTERNAQASRAHQDTLQEKTIAFERERLERSIAAGVELEALRHDKTVDPLRRRDLLSVGLDPDTLRVIIVPPDFASLAGTPQDGAWTQMLQRGLHKAVAEFVQREYGNDPRRSIHVCDPNLLNPTGIDGDTAVRLMQADPALSALPTLWLQADRLDAHGFGLAAAMWDGAHQTAYQHLGRFSCYDVSRRRLSREGLATSMVLGDQIDAAVIHPRTRVLADAGMAPLAHALGGTSASKREEDTIAMHLLAVAVCMLVATHIDMHYLTRGLPPTLPSLISDGVFALDDDDVQDVTASIQGCYASAADGLATRHPENAHDIWLGLAQCSLGAEAAELATAQAWRSICALTRGPGHTVPSRIDFAVEMGQMPWASLSLDYVQRLHAVLKAVGHIAAVEQLEQRLKSWALSSRPAIAQAPRRRLNI